MMDDVTPADCKAVVREARMGYLGHHRCGGCGAMVGWVFREETNVPPAWQTRLGLDGPNDLIVAFDPSCGCGGRGGGIEPTPWSEFARSFNMQTPEHRASMWERFKAGKATHESD